MGALVKQRYMLSAMCGRYTYKLTWEEIVRLYRLALDQPAQNTRARYNVCPTTTIDTIVDRNGARALVGMRLLGESSTQYRTDLRRVSVSNGPTMAMV